MERLKSFSSTGANRGAESFINLVDKSSCPVEFVFFRDLMVSKISACVVLDNTKGFVTGVPRYFLNSEVLSLENLLANFPPISLKKLLKVSDID